MQELYQVRDLDDPAQDSFAAKFNLLQNEFVSAAFVR